MTMYAVEPEHSLDEIGDHRPVSLRFFARPHDVKEAT